jgi:hypothetical protein
VSQALEIEYRDLGYGNWDANEKSHESLDGRSPFSTEQTRLRNVLFQTSFSFMQASHRHFQGLLQEALSLMCCASGTEMLDLEMDLYIFVS